MNSTILIVEDHDAVRASLHDWLSTTFEDCRFLEAKSGEEAVNLVNDQLPDIVLMDISLPQMDGIEATRRIKAAAPRTQVVMLTVHEMPDYQASAAEAGASAYVPKRLMYTELVPTLTKLMSAPQAIPGPIEETRMKNILVVDDSPTMRRMVIAALRGLPGVSFDEAGSGLEAIERLALKPVHLMILDLNMPDIHGLEVLEFVRQHGAFHDIPIIVLTTRGDEASRTAALAAGASLYLTKPFEPRAFAGHARQLLGI